MYSGKFKITVSNKNSTKNSGTVLVGLVLIWVPVLWILGAILWIKVQTLNYVVAQRSLDQCLYKHIQRRCANLRELSSLNYKLILLQEAISAAQLGKIIPGVNIAVSMGEKGAKLIAEAIAVGQDALIFKQKADLALLGQCGMPLAGSLPMTFQRRPTLTSLISGTPHPLVWENPIRSSEIHIFKTNQLQSFAYCSGTGELRGEDYKILFRMAPQQSNVLPFWFLQ